MNNNSFHVHFSNGFFFQNGWNAIMKAACFGHFDIVRLLADNGANINLGTNVSDLFVYGWCY